MRGTKAKRLRRRVYGEQASNAASRKYVRGGNGVVVVDGWHRHSYQLLKRGLVDAPLQLHERGYAFTSPHTIRLKGGATLTSAAPMEAP